MESFEMTVLERETARLAASGANHMPARFAVRAVLHAATSHLLLSDVDVEISCDLAISDAMRRNTAFPPLFFIEIAREITQSSHNRLVPQKIRNLC